jgi:predicted DNA-binding transcriptional regulator AlpA
VKGRAEGARATQGPGVAGSPDQSQSMGASQRRLGLEIPHGRRDSQIGADLPKTDAMTMRARFHHCIDCRQELDLDEPLAAQGTEPVSYERDWVTSLCTQRRTNVTTDASESASATRVAEAARKLVSLSKWVNEKLPAWDEILSARDVARLTRRRCWFVQTLTLLGRFPKRRRFHGRAIGWGKHEVLKWMAENSAIQQDLGGHQRAESVVTYQRPLPMHYPRTGRGRDRCSRRRKGGKS